MNIRKYRMLRTLLKPLKIELVFIKKSLRKIPSLLLAFFLNLKCGKKEFTVCSEIFIYEAIKMNNILNDIKLPKNILFKTYLGYFIIPVSYFKALDVRRVEKSNKYREKNLLINPAILSSEIIKYAHALDKGLRMPNKRDKFGREKSQILEWLLGNWKKQFSVNHPIYIWSVNLLKEYRTDQGLGRDKVNNTK